ARKRGLDPAREPRSRHSPNPGRRPRSSADLVSAGARALAARSVATGAEGQRQFLDFRARADSLEQMKSLLLPEQDADVVDTLGIGYRAPHNPDSFSSQAAKNSVHALPQPVRREVGEIEDIHRAQHVARFGQRLENGMAADVETRRCAAKRFGFGMNQRDRPQ